MKILSWNVGGVHLFDGRTEDGKSYGNEDVDYFSEAVQKTDAMVVALQETPDPFDEKDPSFSEIVGKKSNFAISGDFHYGPSHIKGGNWHSLATLSVGNMSNVYFYKLPNPNLERYWENS